MSKDMHKTTLIGRVGTDPEMRYTPSGTPVTNFRVAVNETWRDASGQEREHTEWYSVVAWQGNAEITNQYLRKGSRVYIEGRLRTRSWDDNGEKRYKTELVLSELVMLDGPNNRREVTSADVEAAERDYAATHMAPTFEPEEEPEPEPEPEPAQASRQTRSRQTRR